MELAQEYFILFIFATPNTTSLCGILPTALSYYCKYYRTMFGKRENIVNACFLFSPTHYMPQFMFTLVYPIGIWIYVFVSNPSKMFLKIAFLLVEVSHIRARSQVLVKLVCHPPTLLYDCLHCRRVACAHYHENHNERHRHSSSVRRGTVKVFIWSFN